MFTSECIDKSYDTVLAQLDSDKDYCIKNPCWDTLRYPFCVCKDSEDDPLEKSGCDDEELKFTSRYLPSETSIYNNSFSNPLIAMVRLIVLISTENYPDIMCKLQFVCW